VFRVLNAPKQKAAERFLPMKGSRNRSAALPFRVHQWTPGFSAQNLQGKPLIGPSLTLLRKETSVSYYVQFRSRLLF